MSATYLKSLYVIAFAAILTAEKLPTVPQRVITSLTPQPGGFSEPSIAVNPTQPRQIVAAFQVNASAAVSMDAGHTWRITTGTAPSNYKVSGDVSVTYDNHGHAFLCYIAFDKLGSFNYWAHGDSRNGVFVRRSLDGGRTWEANHIPVIEHATQSGIPFEDKPYIVADLSRGPHSGNLYVGWTRWSLIDSRILVSRSTDGGKSWSQPLEIDHRPGLPRDDNGALEGFDGAVGPDGTLYVIWNDRDGIVLAHSRNGGRSFSRPRKILDTAPSMFAVQSFSRTNGFPQIAVARATNVRAGRLYVTWADYRNGDLDVFCSTSVDKGRHWSQPVRVNDDPLHDGADQFSQWMAVDPANGAINVLFYDRRQDPENKKQNVVLARSEDRGRSFRNYAWTAEPFDASGPFMGDYSAIAAFGGRVYGAWTAKVEPKTAPPRPARESQQHEPEAHHNPPGGTIVRVGTADFTSTSQTSALPK